MYIWHRDEDRAAILHPDTSIVGLIIHRTIASPLCVINHLRYLRLRRVYLSLQTAWSGMGIYLIYLINWIPCCLVRCLSGNIVISVRRLISIKSGHNMGFLAALDLNWESYRKWAFCYKACNWPDCHNAYYFLAWGTAPEALMWMLFVLEPTGILGNQHTMGQWPLPFCRTFVLLVLYEISPKWEFKQFGGRQGISLIHPFEENPFDCFFLQFQTRN